MTDVPDLISFRLRVGVTGHRELSDLHDLERAHAVLTRHDGVVSVTVPLDEPAIATLVPRAVAVGAVARELRDSVGGRKVLLPRSDRGDRRLLSALRGCGADVTEVIVYRTAAPETLDPEVLNRIRRGFHILLRRAGQPAGDGRDVVERRARRIERRLGEDGVNERAEGGAFRSLAGP